MKLQVKKYSQNNPEWKRQPIDDSPYNLGKAGCYISCLSMVLDYYGKGMNPRHLLEVLERIGAVGKSGKLNMWTAAKHFNFTFGGLENFDNGPAPVNRIIKRIDDGHPTIIRVDFIPETRPIDQHFVVVTGYTEKDLIVNDPWHYPAEEYFLTAKYPHTNNRWNQPKYVIYGIRELTPNFEIVDESDTLHACQKAHRDAMTALHRCEEREKKLGKKLEHNKHIRKELANSVESLLKNEEKLKEKVKKLSEENKELARMNQKLNGSVQFWQPKAESAEKEIKQLKTDLKECRGLCKDWENKANLGIEQYKTKELIIEIIGRVLMIND